MFKPFFEKRRAFVFRKRLGELNHGSLYETFDLDLRCNHVSISLVDRDKIEGFGTEKFRECFAVLAKLPEEGTEAASVILP